MVWRLDWNGARASCAIAKSMPPLMAVRSANARGASTIWAEKSLAVASSRIMVQSITIFCAPTPDHSTRLTAILPSPPERMASITRGLTMAAA